MARMMTPLLWSSSLLCGGMRDAGAQTLYVRRRACARRPAFPDTKGYQVDLAGQADEKRPSMLIEQAVITESYGSTLVPAG